MAGPYERLVGISDSALKATTPAVAPGDVGGAALAASQEVAFSEIAAMLAGGDQQVANYLIDEFTPTVSYPIDANSFGSPNVAYFDTRNVMGDPSMSAPSASAFVTGGNPQLVPQQMAFLGQVPESLPSTGSDISSELNGRGGGGGGGNFVMGMDANMTGATDNFAPNSHDSHNHNNDDDDDGDDDGDNHDGDNNGGRRRSGRSKAKAAPEKKKRRAMQNRAASKNYRARKKAYLKSLEEQVATLTAENRTYKANAIDSAAQINSLKQQNIRLQEMLAEAGLDPGTGGTGGAQRAEMISRKENEHILAVKQRALYAELEQEVAASATEDVLADTLEQLNLNCRKRHNLYGTDVEELINPDSIISRTLLTGDEDVDIYLNEETEMDYWRRAGADIGLSQAQQDELIRIRTEYLRSLKELEKERSSLNHDLRDFFSRHMNQMRRIRRMDTNDLPNVPEVVEISEKIQRLRDNLNTERQLSCDMHRAIKRMMTTRQEALLVLRVQRNEVYTSNMLQALLDMARSAHPNANVMSHKSTSDASAPTSDMDVDARVAGMG